MPEPESRWDGDSYRASADHHRALDDWFLQRRPPRPDDVVVDLGSGSGEFTARLAEISHRGRVIGIEPDRSMLEAAQRHRQTNLSFIGARAEELGEVVENGSVDLVVSRAMLHWLPPETYPDVFAAVHRVLRPGGWYHSESGGAGNVAAVVDLLHDLAARFDVAPPRPFPHPGTVLEMLEHVGMEVPVEGVRTVAQRRPFSREGIMEFVRTQATVALTGEVSDERAERIRSTALEEIEVLRRHDGTYDQTFVRLEILATRPV